MRGLFRWAAKAQLVKVDPTAGIENPARRRATASSVDRGACRRIRGALADRDAAESVARRSALYRFAPRRRRTTRPPAVRNGVGDDQDGKSGSTVTVTLPILPVLAETLAAGPCGDLTFIVGERGQPLTKETFGNMFREACGGRRARLGAWRAQDRGHARGKCRRDRGSARSDLRMDAAAAWRRSTRAPPTQALALEAITSSRERERTSIPAPAVRCGPSGKSQLFRRLIFWDGGGGRIRTYEGVSQRI